jgi:hypothetical protein
MNELKKTNTEILREMNILKEKHEYIKSEIIKKCDELDGIELSILELTKLLNERIGNNK